MKFSVWLFLRELMANPKAMGAAYPSSKQLAKQMAKQIPMPVQGKILELGPGTGVVTQALIEYGVPSQQLILIERSENLAKYLQQRFPELRIIQGDAVMMSQLLRSESGKVSVVVSSLPLLLLEETTLEKLEQELKKVLQPNGLFVHFTYKIYHPKYYFSDAFRCVYSKPIWFNIPPARVEVYRYAI